MAIFHTRTENICQMVPPPPPLHLFNLLDSFIASAVVEQTVERRKPKLTPAKPEYHDKCDFLHFETIDEQAQDF